MVRANEQARGYQTFTTISIPPGPRLGNLVLEVEGLEKDYGEKVLFKGACRSSCRPTASSA